MWLRAAGCLKLLEPFNAVVMSLSRGEEQEPVGD